MSSLTGSQAAVCVFCGSRSGKDPEYARAARELGWGLAERGWRLVYGGGNVGLMGVLADAVLERGGQVTGVIPDALMTRELAHASVQDMRIVPSMHARKALMAELSSAFVALPGGLGTLEELCEILTWSQLEFHTKPAALLNTGSYFDPLLSQLDRAVEQDFMSARNRNLVRVCQTATELLRWCEPFLGKPTPASPEFLEKT